MSFGNQQEDGNIGSESPRSPRKRTIEEAGLEENLASALTESLRANKLKSDDSKTDGQPRTEEESKSVPMQNPLVEKAEVAPIVMDKMVGKANQ